MPSSKYPKAGALPLTPTTLGVDTVIPTGYQMVVFDTFTGPAGKSLTVEAGGSLIITNYIVTR